MKNKKERTERIREMLKALNSEQEHEGGFNEFPQCCEEWLRDYVEHLDEAGQTKLIEDIERTSNLGITRRSPTVKPGKGRRLYS